MSVDAEYVAEQINSLIYSTTCFEKILPSDFCTVSKIIIHCTLIKRFPTTIKDNLAIYKKSILPRMALIKVCLESIKTAILKKFSYHK